MRLFATLTLAGLALAPVASAQYGPVLSNGMAVGVTAKFPDGGTIIGANVGIARPMYDATLGFEHIESTNSIYVGGTYYALAPTEVMPLKAGAGVEGSYAMTSVEVMGNDYDASTLGVMPYVDVSYRLALSPTITFVPEARLGYMFASTKAEGSDAVSNNDFAGRVLGNFVVALGTSNVAISPMIDFGNGTTFGVRAAYLMGR